MSGKAYRLTFPCPFRIHDGRRHTPPDRLGFLGSFAAEGRLVTALAGTQRRRMVL